MKDLYHYTDIQGVLGILKFRKLWLSSVNNMNDHQEIIWLKSKLKAEIDKVVRVGNYSDSYIDIFRTFVTILEHSTSTPYICCFSKNHDLLSQWRAYAHDGVGANIGFSINKLNVSNELPYMSTVKEQALGYSEVTYNEGLSNIFVTNLVDVLLKLCEESKLENGKPVWHPAMSELATTCLRSAQAFKNPAFSEEQEVRIIHTPYSDKSNNWHGNVSDIQFRVVNDSITSYFELEFPHDAVTSITLGPKSKCSEAELELFLKSNGYENVVVRNSSASYR
ncbi:DUF2971 domain-containing protein [Vibrio ouci]|uniref:DUF2971 domain-containing protein n=1 Tax=Vibrio ouci TaxID=2499078 RepID=A0A4Y8W8Z0_9VIBR|nr:DUF2971 domain-containing protein [Vibrio ouci]TFH89287.1 DUF2971 domain-containing protein [Vibrio ouci]